MSDYPVGGEAINQELLSWLPLDAQRVLEIGCGTGALAGAYRLRNPTADYVATEADPLAAEQAGPRVDRLVQADFMALGEADCEALGLFDLVILNDGVSRVPSPLALLTRIRRLLRKRGHLCLTVPNFSHWSVLAALMSGAWPKAEAGLFDHGHLQVMTLQSLAGLLGETGLRFERARPRKPAAVGDQEKWTSVLADAFAQAGGDRGQFIERAGTVQYVASVRPDAVTVKPPLHVHIVAMAPNFAAVRTSLPAEALQSDASLRVTYAERTMNLAGPASGFDPRIVVLQRAIMEEDVHWREYLKRAKAAGYLTVFEIDDHPDLIGRVYQGGDMAQRLWAMVLGSHAVQTSTEELAKALRQVNPEVAVFPNALLDLPPFRSRSSSKRVFYGALNREGFSRRVAESLRPAIEADPDLAFSIIHDKAFFDALPTERKTFRTATAYPEYRAAMAESDIVLSPLEGSEEERFKSDVKFIEATQAGAVMIASPAVYAASIVGGVTGLIAPGLEDWSVQLLRLSRDPDLRNAIAEAAWRDVRDHRMLRTQTKMRADWYRSLIDRREALETALFERQPHLRP